MKAEQKINREHEKPILQVIETKPVFSFNDVFVYYKAICRATAYNHNLDKLDSIKEAIYSNKRKGVTSLMAKWLKSDNATLQIAAMRLICENEEHKKLNQQYIDHTSRGEKMGTVVTTLSEDELKERLKK